MESKKTYRNTLVYGIILAIIFGIVYTKIFDKKLDMNGDNFNYLLLSKNIKNGHGYTNYSYDGSYKPAGWFPPGYPYLLAAAQFVVGDSTNAFKILNGLLFFATVLLFFFLIKQITKNELFALSVSVFILLCSGLLRLSTVIMSEIPFLFFTILAIYSSIRAEEDTESKQFFKSRYFYVAVFSSIIAYYIRSFGMLTIMALTLHWLLQKKWNISAAYFMSNVILYLPYFIRNKVEGIEGRYMKTIMVNNPWRPESGQVSSFSEFWDKIVTNLNDTIIHGFPKVLFPSIDVTEPGFMLTVFGLIIIFLVFLGVWNLGKYKYLFGSYIIFNMGILLLWHTGNGVRYVWPLAGFIAFTSFYGIYILISKRVLKNKQGASYKYLGLFFLVLSLFSFSEIKKIEKQADSKLNPAYENYFRIARELKKQPDSENYLVVCRKPSLFSYYSNTRTMNYPYSLDDKVIIQKIIDTGADLVVLEQLGYSSTPRYLLPAIQKNQELFQTVMHLKNPDTYLLWFNKEKAKENKY